jgi:hypothetical protein
MRHRFPHRCPAAVSSSIEERWPLRFSAQTDFYQHIGIKGRSKADSHRPPDRGGASGICQHYSGSKREIVLSDGSRCSSALIPICFAWRQSIAKFVLQILDLMKEYKIFHPADEEEEEEESPLPRPPLSAQILTEFRSQKAAPESLAMRVSRGAVCFQSSLFVYRLRRHIRTLEAGAKTHLNLAWAVALRFGCPPVGRAL